MEVHNDFSHRHGTEMRVSKASLVESLARAALKHVPGGPALVDKHFRKDEPRQALKPAPIKHQKWYSGHGTV